MKTYTLNVILKWSAMLLCIFCMTLPTAHAKKLALVVGNNNYINGRLERPEADAKAVKASLETLGYSVTLELNATKPDFDRVLSTFKRQIEAGDDVILFFSGHGIDLPLRGNVLLGVFDMSQELDDYDLLKQAGIVVSDTLSELAERKPRMVLALLDACRTFMRRTGTKSLGNQTLSRQEPPTGQMVLYASKQGEPSWDLVDHSDKHTLSPFTRILVQELTRPNQPLSFLEQRVRTGVKALFDAAAPDPRLGNKRRTQTPMGFSTLEGDPSYSLNQVVLTVSVVTPAPVGAAPTPARVPAVAKPAQPIMIEDYEILDDPVVGKGSLARDPKTGLLWQRCSVGQTWDGRSCVGEAKRFTFADAQKLAANDWRVPTLRELSSLIYCSSGKTKDSDDPRDGGAAIANWCDGDYTRPTIRTGAFPKTATGRYWSSSPYVGNSSVAWNVSFGYGDVNSSYRYGSIYVRLVR